MPPVQCIGKDGVVRTFNYTYSAPSMVGESHTFFIATVPLPASGNQFQMTLEDIDDNNVRVVMSDHLNDEAYASKGIAEAMIPVIARVLNKNVHSSSGTALQSGRYRLPRATAYWRRTAGATYKQDEDVFTYPRPAPAAAARDAIAEEKKDDACHENNG